VIDDLIARRIVASRSPNAFAPDAHSRVIMAMVNSKIAATLKIATPSRLDDAK
jgi:hypothetical protein